MSQILLENVKVGDEVQGFFVIKNVNVKSSSNNKMYLDLTLCDNSSEINGKVWDVNNDMIGTFSAGSVAKVKGSVTSWQNNLQLKIVRIRPTTEEDEINYETLIKSAPLKAKEMYSEIMSYIESMKNEDVKKLVKFLFEEKKEKLQYYPAAKSNHHSIRAGLLFHILRMLRSAKGLLGVYENLNSDLLYGGIILHDLEKVNEMSSDHLGIVSDYTKEGQLLGHIIMGIKKIDETAKSLNIPEEISQIFQHMVLSHHYEPEYGSPKKPMVPEGELLHYIDMIDARVYDMEKALSSVEPGEFSDNVFVLDRRKLYKSNI